MISLRKVGYFVLACLGLLFIGCTPSKEVPDSRPAMEGYPLTIENYDGYGGKGELIPQTFYQPPERIVATSEMTVDNLIFLGLEDKIVGISDMTSKFHAPYDEIYARLPRLNSFGSYPSREQIIAVQPDIIIGWGSLFEENAIGSVKEWHVRGIHTYVMKNTVPTRATGDRKVRYFLDDLENLSKIFHISEQTEPKIDELRKRLDRAEAWSNRIPEWERPTVMTVQYTYGNSYFGRTNTDMISDIIWLAGGRSVDGRFGNRQSIEFLLEKNPDIILLIDMSNQSSTWKTNAMEQNPILQNVKAVQNKNFLVINFNAFYCGSFRTIDELERLQKLVKNNVKKDY